MPGRDTVEREWERRIQEEEIERTPSETPEEAPSGLARDTEDRPTGQTPLQEATAGPSRKGDRGLKKGLKRLQAEKATLPGAFIREMIRIHKDHCKAFARRAKGTIPAYKAM